MAYKANIPQPTDNLSVSQNDLLNNFAQLDTTMGVNHFRFSDTSGNTGKHSFVEMVKLASVPTISAGEGAFYTKTASSITNAFYTADTGGKEYQLTRCIDASFARFGAFFTDPAPPAGTVSKFGWTFLPGGLLLQYGTISGTAPTSLPATATVNFPVAFNNVPYSITMTVNRDTPADARNSISRTTPPTNTQFTFIISAATAQALFWMAIGN